MMALTGPEISRVLDPAARLAPNAGLGTSREGDYNQLLKDTEGQIWDCECCAWDPAGTEPPDLTNLLIPYQKKTGKSWRLTCRAFSWSPLSRRWRRCFWCRLIKCSLGMGYRQPHSSHSSYSWKETRMPSIPLNSWPCHSSSSCLIFLRSLESAKAPGKFGKRWWELHCGTKVGS